MICFSENTYATTSSKRYWKQIEKNLIDIFKDYGADHFKMYSRCTLFKNYASDIDIFKFVPRMGTF